MFKYVSFILRAHAKTTSHFDGECITPDIVAETRNMSIFLFFRALLGMRLNTKICEFITAQTLSATHKLNNQFVSFAISAWHLTSHSSIFHVGLVASCLTRVNLLFIYFGFLSENGLLLMLRLVEDSSMTRLPI